MSLLKLVIKVSIFFLVSCSLEVFCEEELLEELFDEVFEDALPSEPKFETTK